MTFRNHNIVAFLASQNISLFGSMLVQYAIMWHITLTTGSGLMMTISILCGFLPTLLVSPFAGVWADRYDRKRIIILADLLTAASTLILAVVYLLGYRHIGFLYGALLVRSLGNGIQTPTIGAVLPSLVPQEQLTRINGINSSLQALVTLLSPMLGGVLLTLWDLPQIFLIDVATAALAILLLVFFLHIPSQAPKDGSPATDYLEDMKLGLTYIRREAFIRTIFLYCALYFILVSPMAFLTPLQVTRSFGPDVWRLTAIEVFFSGGMMLGGLLIAAWGGFSNRSHTMGLAYLVVAVCGAGLGLTGSFPLYLSLMALTGLAMPLFNTPFTVLIQEKTDPDYLGRVFGVLGMISSSVMPLSMLFFGPLADRVPIESILVISGILMFFQGLHLLRNRTLLKAGAPLKPEIPETALP